jgi:DNA-directed RNA polymerase subunit RPC12/RpoP
MAVRQIAPSEESKDRIRCPKCGEEALIIDSKLVQWITCPSCKFKKLVKKRDKGIKVTPLK